MLNSQKKRRSATHSKKKAARVGSPVTFAWPQVAAELKAARLSRSFTIRDLAAEVGCDHTVIFRLERATPVAVEHLLSLLLWLGREPFQFTAVARKFKSKLAPSVAGKLAGRAQRKPARVKRAGKR